MESHRSARRIILAAVLVNLFVLGACFALVGWSNQGAGSATRNTARFASAFFVVGFAAPGLRRWLPALCEADWLRAFVAAQMVHFGAVSLLHLVFLKDTGAAPMLQVTAFVLFGFSLVLSVGLLAEYRTGIGGIVRLFAVHLVFLIFAVDYLKHPIRPLRIMAVIYLSALVLRYMPFKQRAMSTAG